MLFEYNGARLEIENVLAFSERAVYSDEGKDYLHTHYKMRLQFIAHPRAMTNLGTTAASSIASLNTTLMTPRKYLKFSIPIGGAASSTVVVAAPLKRPNGDLYACDAELGPAPVEFRVVQWIGEQTAICEYEIECWVNHCTTARPLLSHRWETRHEIDQDYFTTRFITGEAIFRADLMFGDGTGTPMNPDDYRAAIMHAIPSGFRRVSAIVTQNPNGTGLRYTVTDQEQKLTLVEPYKRSISRIEGTVAWGMGPLTNPVTNPSTAGLPTRTAKITIRAYGNKYTLNSHLVAAISRALLTFRYFGPFVTGDLTGQNGRLRAAYYYSSEIRFRLERPEAEYTGEFRIPGIPSSAANALGVGPFNINVAELDSRIGGTIDGTPDASVASYTAPPDGPPNDSKTRGTYIAHIVSQGLLAGCSYPNKPANPTSFTNRTYTGPNGL